MPGQNDLGPWGPGVNETATEPASLGDSGVSAYSWFKDCTSPTSRDGTKFTAQFANRMLKYIRRACDGMGIARDETDGDRLLKAIQKADRPLENIGSGAGVYAGINGTNGKYSLKSIRAGAGIGVTSDDDEIFIAALGGGGSPGVGQTSETVIVKHRQNELVNFIVPPQTWTALPMNYVAVNEAAASAVLEDWCTVDTGLSRFTLLPGRYRFRAWHQASYCQGAGLRLWNVTDSAEVEDGMHFHSLDASVVLAQIPLIAAFDVPSGGRTYQVQGWAEISAPSSPLASGPFGYDGFVSQSIGVPGRPSVFGIYEITRVN
jgi:hypothetical protein